jgi:pimeloyl-ACP methyl ester carboxylesterase
VLNGSQTTSEVEPFAIDVPERVLEDLHERLARTRWPSEVEHAGWDYGTDLAYLQELCAYWRDEFDWRAQERKLNQLPQFTTEIDGQLLHFVHLRGRGPEPLPIVLTHGWPSSFFEFTKLAPKLADEDLDGSSFDVVIPSLPGFGFSAIPGHRFASATVPGLWVELMRRLGYERFAAHGGDLGGGITARLAQFHRDSVVGIHVTSVYGDIGGEPPSAAERAYLLEQERWEREEGAYGAVQSTRPQSLSYGLTDSPAGLAGWLIEKHRSWSDCGGDLESVFTKDELLTNLTIYWATNTIGSSLRPYWDSLNNPQRAPWIPVEAPSAIAVFPGDLDRPPREFAERWYDVRRWTEMPRGGHFAALEQPGLLADDIRAFFRGLRAESSRNTGMVENKC